ncbi:MAG TPA: diguanylate cyclase, partial [Candidatus Acidoferrales bacterium]|nr:diguanylate cyclase [Candidatus Acidoferrales bacterium]
MDRKPVTVRAWASWSGIVATVLSALVLAVVLTQVAQLDRAGGLDPATRDLDLAAVRTSNALNDIAETVGEYRYALALRRPPSEIAGLRADVDARLVPLDEAYGTGPASGLDPHHQWSAVTAAWSKARVARPGEGGIRASNDVVAAIEDMVYLNLNGSNLNYDSYSSAQDLADLAINGPPVMYENIARSQVVIELAVADRAMSLPQRMRLSNALAAIRAGADLETDQVPNVVKTISLVVGDKAAKLPGLAERYSATAMAYRKVLVDGALLQPTPIVAAGAIDRAAKPALQASHDLRAFATALLEDSIAARGKFYEMRQRYIYVALMVGAILLVALMLAIAQFAAHRNGDLLRRAQEESQRLTTELARQHAEEALRLSEAQFRAVFDGAAVGIAVLDRGGNVVDANAVFRSLFSEGVAAALEGHEQELADLLAGERDTFEFEQHLNTRLGQEVWTDATVSVVNDESGTPLFAICMFRDKTALKHSERRMQHDKTHDVLTGLPNRQLFEEHLRRRFEEASALLDSFFAVIFVDLEHFRDVNETFGHAAGDTVLTQVAQRLRSSVDVRDVVARLGSDEFAVLLQSLGDILHVESVARRVLNNLSKMITINGRAIYLGASVGIAIGSSSYERAEDVTRDAEIAMQHAKSGGGSRYALFDSKMQDRAQKRLQLTSDIRQALERNEFRLL